MFEVTYLQWISPSAIGLVVKYLVANEMPRVRFPDGASLSFAYIPITPHLCLYMSICIALAVFLPGLNARNYDFPDNYIIRNP
jgi:hypothetical protein